MRLEGFELIGPERLHLVEPCLEGDEGLGTQPVDAYTRVVADALGCDFDQAAGAQYAQVPAHGGTAHRGRGGELAGTARTLAEQVHHLPASRVGQGGQRPIEFIHH